MHLVVRADSGIETFADLEGKTILAGKGSFGAKEGAKYLGLFGLEDKVTLADIELDNAVPALKNKQNDGIVTASLPVVAHTTTSMDEETAYQLTKTYWSQKTDMGSNATWWNGVSGTMLDNIHGKIHPGALRYYDEAAINVSEDSR